MEREMRKGGDILTMSYVFTLVRAMVIFRHYC